MPIRMATLAIALLAGLAPGLTAAAQDFSGKTVTLIVGYPPGGGYDTYARVLVRHFGRHLPGTPNVVLQHQPGAGSLIAANLLYNTSPKDGTAIGLFASSAALEPLVGNPQAKFDTNKFTWIGNLNRDTAACGAWHTSGIKTWEDAVKKGARFGGSGPAAITSQHALFLRNVLGAPFNVIMGYGGTNDVNLAMHRGEVDASCGMYVSSARGAYRADVESGRLTMIVQFGKHDEPYFKGAANIHKLVTSQDDLRLTEFIFGQTELTRPIAAPPGVPEPVASALRTALDRTVKDPAFLADAEKAQIDIVPMTGAETAKAFAAFAATPKAVIDRARVVVMPK